MSAAFRSEVAVSKPDWLEARAKAAAEEGGPTSATTKEANTDVVSSA